MALLQGSLHTKFNVVTNISVNSDALNILENKTTYNNYSMQSKNILVQCDMWQTGTKSE